MVNSLLHSLQQVDKEKTTKIVNLARNLVDTKKSIEELEAKIKELKEKERIISEEQIPKFLQEMGIDAIKTPFGTIGYNLKYRGYITKTNQSKAFEWLRKEGHGDIIKTEVSASFGMGDTDKAQDLLATMRKGGINPNFKEGVHHGTLSSWIKDMTEKGKDIT
jgi:5'-3' exonuclease